jgi:hypothetical protein
LKSRTVRRRTSSVMDGADSRLRQPDSDAIETTFELNDTLYAKAEIPPTDEVYLWLGVGRGPLLFGWDVRSRANT